MTLGAVINLFNAIKDEKTKTEICKHYGINKVVVFNSYINLVRKIRNQCAMVTYCMTYRYRLP